MHRLGAIVVGWIAGAVGTPLCGLTVRVGACLQREK